MSQSDTKYISPKEYLRREVKALEKHEYFEGKITQRNPSCINHSRILVNCIYAFHPALKGSGNHVYDSNLRILAQKITFFTYPDLSIVRGKEKMMRGREDVLLNPYLLVEIMSPNTRNYDRGEKFQRYRAFDSLEVYLLIDQAKIYVECFEKQPDGSWVLKIYKRRGHEIVLAGLGISVNVGEFYRKVKLKPRITKKRGMIYLHPFKIMV